jgi:hypothetical protein
VSVLYIYTLFGDVSLTLSRDRIAFVHLWLQACRLGWYGEYTNLDIWCMHSKPSNDVLGNYQSPIGLNLAEVAMDLAIVEHEQCNIHLFE